MVDYGSFRAFVESAVVPRHRSRPADVRLDGRTVGGNRETFGTFWWGGRRWKVHADTHYAPLLIAHEAILRGDEPFLVTETQRTGNVCLELVPWLHAQLGTKAKLLYIYELVAR